MRVETGEYNVPDICIFGKNEASSFSFCNSSSFRAKTVLKFWSSIFRIYSYLLSISGQSDLIPVFLDNSRRDPAGNYMFKVNNRNTRSRCDICSKLTIKSP